jgi:hypothetical protein
MTTFERWGIKYQGPREPHCLRMDDGYWTPWHIAQEECDQLRDSLDAARSSAFKEAVRATQLETELAAAREALRWIPVEERLPTHIHSVLMYVVSDGGALQDSPYVEIGIYNDTRGKWQMNYGDDDIDVEVTHWMPLPELPVLHAQREGE